ncbi:hypothetical protein AMTRI_Chr02g266740 [Amborella trichopoda]
MWMSFSQTYGSYASLHGEVQRRQEEAQERPAKKREAMSRFVKGATSMKKWETMARSVKRKCGLREEGGERDVKKLGKTIGAQELISHGAAVLFLRCVFHNLFFFFWPKRGKIYSFIKFLI